MPNPQSSFTATTFTPTSFWARRREVVRATTLRYQLDVLRNTGRYDAFRLQWHPIYSEPVKETWPVPKHLFWDSDVAKWLEGACYFLGEEEDVEIEKAVEELTDMIRGAQQGDGYLNIHFTVVQPGLRFTNLRDMHELYNAGHLIEAALAHQFHFKNNSLLEPILKYVDLLCAVFGTEPGQLRGYPGHPEIELSLLRLYKHTGSAKHLRLARFFIDERGNPNGGDGQHYYAAESKRRGDVVAQVPRHFPSSGVDGYRYQQAHLPITQQETIEGHSVRAMYLLTAVADLCSIDGAAESKYRDALYRLWDNMVERKMYVTGGIGAIAQWEGFGIDYFLPQGTDEGGCYAETCAAIGVVMLAERMLQIDRDAKYADIMELALYNCVLTGMSHSGKAFTYTNQLASSPGHPSQREEWFECACCPPNVTRLFGSLGGYVWSFAQTAAVAATVDVFLYTAAELAFKVGDATVRLEQVTDWPFDGVVRFSLAADEGVDVTLRLRIPGWADEWDISPKPPTTHLEKGFLTLPTSHLHEHPSFTLTIPLLPRLRTPHPYTNQRTAAVARGPLVYCVEDVDNPWVRDHFKSVVFDTSVRLVESERDDVVDGEKCVGITAEGAARVGGLLEAWSPVGGVVGGMREANGAGGGENGVAERRETLRFVPYYARANRGGEGMMRVGLRVA